MRHTPSERWPPTADGRGPDGERRTDRTADRYAGFGTEDGYVLYDTENGAAWIQSDAAVEPAEHR
jgi:hypothetical protein